MAQDAAPARVAGLLAGDEAQVRAALGREPTPTEWALFSVMWSEHCAYRHSRALLARLPSVGPAVVQGPGENAGILDLGDGVGLALKVESHNHPSAVEPYQGAATGVGGILRDVLALGARPVALMDALGLGPLDDPRAAWLARGIVGGVGGYGNAVGVPTVGGVTRIGRGFARTPLLNAMCAGLVPLDRIVYGRARRAGDLLVLLGATTGRDGVGGARFASEGLDADRAQSRPQVQVGDPFCEKRLIEATLQAMDAGLVLGCQDMGAAGIVSSTTELCHRAGLGCDLDLDRVPLRQPGMQAWEILLSESQERMLLTIDPDDLPALEAIGRHWSLEVAAIGVVRDEPVYRVVRGGAVVAELPLDLLCEAPPARPALDRWPRAAEARAPELLPFELPGIVARLLGGGAVGGRAFIYESYDSMVGARTHLGPPSGAAVLTLPGRPDGVALSLDMNPDLAQADPYVAAALTVVEGVQNLAAVGAEALGVTDCLNLGDPTTPTAGAELEATIAGLADACRALGLPVVGGNVSLYNSADGERMPPTLTLGTAGRVARVERRPARGLQRAGDALVLVGPLAGDLGASAYAALVLGASAGAPAAPDFERVARTAAFVRRARARAEARFALDVWRGGLVIALLRALVAGGRGARIDLPAEAAGRLAAVLFGEGPARYLLAAAPRRAERLVDRAAAAGVEARVVGAVTGDGAVALGVDGTPLATVPVAQAVAAYRGEWP